VSGFIFAENDLLHLRVRLDAHPPRDYLSYAIHKSDIRLGILDYTGKPATDGPRLTLAPTVPDLVRPAEDDEGGDNAWIDLLMDRKSAKPGYYRVKLTAAVDATDPET
jgi:hypothetical protein